MTAGARWTRWPTEHGFAAGALDFLFIDHDKDAYLADLQSILDRGWLHPGSIVVADNVKCPARRSTASTCEQQQGKLWDTIEHKTHVEYQTPVPIWCWSRSTWAAEAPR